MGKYYSRHGRNLYIYVTRNDTLINLKYFPPELNLFEAESSWQIHEKVAIANDVKERNIDKAEIILSLNSYMRWDLPEETLMRYYNGGDESILGEPVAEKPTVPAEVRERPRTDELEVIIPEAKAPPQTQDVAVRLEEQAPPADSVVIPVTPPRQVPMQMTEDEFVDRIIDRLQKRGLLSQYPTPQPPPLQPYRPIPPSNQRQAPSAVSDEALQQLLELLRGRLPSKDREPIASAVVGMITQLSEYVSSITPETPKQAPKPPLEELITSLTAYVKSITPRQQAPDGISIVSPSEEETIDISESQDVVDTSVVEVERFRNQKALMKYLDENHERQIGALNQVKEHWVEIEPTLHKVSEEPYHVVRLKTIKRSPDEEALDPEKIDDRGQLTDLPIRVTDQEEVPDFNLSPNRELKSHLLSLQANLLDLLEKAQSGSAFIRKELQRTVLNMTDVLAEKLVIKIRFIEEVEGLRERISTLLGDEKMVFLKSVDPELRTGKVERPETTPAYEALFVIIDKYNAM
ncbi:MAG: hypothetical protein JSV27_09655 [Candidatus Bathyarchaeota archaeon]|nr:MAG: hypothetical protein JSV27_09655 [Candidatus Bathyarchaeota archaeon]